MKEEKGGERQQKQFYSWSAKKNTITGGWRAREGLSVVHE